MRIERNGNRIGVYPEGRIDTVTAPQFAAEMEQALADAEELKLDFSELSYISSSGLRVVLMAAKTMARQGSMCIVNVSEEVYEILETTGFTGICDVEMKS